MLYATLCPGRYRDRHHRLQALGPLLSQALAESSSVFQGSKGEPGKGEMVDYNGNINEALQVSGSHSRGWRSQVLAELFAQLGNTWLWPSQEPLGVPWFPSSANYHVLWGHMTLGHPLRLVGAASTSLKTSVFLQFHPVSSS